MIGEEKFALATPIFVDHARRLGIAAKPRLIAG